MPGRHPSAFPEAAANALSLRHLVRVVYLAEFRNVADVADRVSCSATAVVKSINAVERLLKVPLFERSSGNYRVTPAGEILSRRSRLAWEVFRRIGDNLEAASALLLSVSNKRAAAFLAAFHHRNLEQSARQLGVTISAIYGAIAALEKLFGRELFERLRHGELIPTPFGHELAKALKLVHTEVRFAIEEIASLGSSPRGRVQIGVLPRAREYLLPHALNRLLSDHPDINVRVLDAPGPNLLTGVLSGDLDFVVGPFKPKSRASGLISEPLLVDHFIAIARRDHPLATMSRPTLAEAVADFGWVVGFTGSMGREIFREILREKGLDEPRQLVETNSFSLVRGLLIEKDWIALSSVAELYNAPEAGLLSTLDLHLSLGPQHDAELPISVLKRIDTTLPPAAQLALDYVQGAAAETGKHLERARSRMFKRLRSVK